MKKTLSLWKGSKLRLKGIRKRKRSRVPVYYVFIPRGLFLLPFPNFACTEHHSFYSSDGLRNNQPRTVQEHLAYVKVVTNIMVQFQENLLLLRFTQHFSAKRKRNHQKEIIQIHIHSSIFNTNNHQAEHQFTLVRDRANWLGCKSASSDLFQPSTI